MSIKDDVLKEIELKNITSGRSPKYSEQFGAEYTKMITFIMRRFFSERGKVFKLKNNLNT